MMTIYCTHINEQGYVVDTHLFTDEQIDSFDGILLVDTTPPIGVVGEDCPIKPKWNGTKWIEGATQQEIDDYYASLPKPTITDSERIEQLEHDNADLWFENFTVKTELDNTKNELNTANTEIADLWYTILTRGGN